MFGEVLFMDEDVTVEVDLGGYTYDAAVYQPDPAESEPVHETPEQRHERIWAAIVMAATS